MTQRLVILGAGGFGREVLDVIEAINEGGAASEAQHFEVLGFLDDGHPESATLAPYDVKHLGSTAELGAMPRDVGFVVGIGNPTLRRRLVEEHADRSQPALVHPSVTMGRAVTVGSGSVVCAGVRLTTNITIGRHVHLNLNSTVGHDARVHDYVTVSPLVAISGFVTLESEVMIGTGVTLNPGVTVGVGSAIGSGAAVLRDVPSGVTAVGVPAKVR